MLEARIHQSAAQNRQNDRGRQQEILVLGLRSHHYSVLRNLPETGRFTSNPSDREQWWFYGTGWWVYTGPGKQKPDFGGVISAE